ncbi:conserved hypothetical protein [Verticillium alfalfae VaMs.102]|uniref:J domain-containing protein n=1 Tax=Verticillium alfalfae (strain VaMs.102 / ATCC MYA-4576 / FGSC 10136) TaxID=526221 RepID=C9SV95_VERA1|nr:conserved hypothetical protein [Verticillium alfalfae VaMs.102]EEY22710.1 conserved hypothetical protein [Verticillium alfalfae VaMs.102]
MSGYPTSPRRRHILSSINPENDDDEPPSKRRRRSASPSRDRDEERSHARREHTRKRDTERDSQKNRPPRARSKDEARTYETEETSGAGDHKPRAKRFRFKSSHSRPSHRHDDDPEHRASSPSRRKRHRRRQPRSPTPPDPYAPQPLSPDAAFRESLFDAMADDEGAAYWESVYGQPVHEYAAEARGELEQMNEEEYATYVRRRMWEKTHEGLLEEREARKKARDAAQEAQAREDRDARRRERVNREMEESLRRGEERRARRGWKDRFAEYGRAWAAWEADTGARDAKDLPWPVESGKRADVGDGALVRPFFLLGLDAAGIGERDFAARLREERVRWHPDKIQQRVAGGHVDPEVMRDVTAVFQVVDKLWGETRQGK